MPLAPVVILSGDADTQDLYVYAFRMERKAAFGVTVADEAASLARDMRLAAIVVDVRGDGDWAICRALTQLHTTREMPLVVVTGYLTADGRYPGLARRLGCAAFISKPALPRTVIQAVERAAGGERGIEIVDVGASGTSASTAPRHA